MLLANHALFVIEAKEWYGRLTGDEIPRRARERHRGPALRQGVLLVPRMRIFHQGDRSQSSRKDPSALQPP